jgi:hypothetical protein
MVDVFVLTILFALVVLGPRLGRLTSGRAVAPSPKSAPTGGELVLQHQASSTAQSIS